MLERSLRTTFRNFSTLLLVVGLVTVPLHLAYSYAFRDVLAVSDLHPYIEELTQGRRVKNVGRARLADSRTAFGMLTVVELLFVPLMAGAAIRLTEVDDSGGLPSVLDAYRHAPGKLWQALGARGRRRRSVGAVTAVLGAFALAAVVGWLLEDIGLTLAEPFDDGVLWALAGTVRGVARAVAAPFFIVALALALSRSPERDPAELR